MQAASLFDGFSFDLFPPFENGLTAPEVDVSRRQVVQALVVSTVVVVLDELLDALFELSWQVVVLQQDPVFHRAVISLDLALRHRVVRPAADMSDAVVIEPLAKLALGHVGCRHGGAQLPGQDVAREVIEHGGQIEPAPADDLQIREVGLPKLVWGGRRIGEDPRPALPPDDAGQDREISPLDEKPDPAREQLPAPPKRPQW